MIYIGDFVRLNTALCMDGERDTFSMHSGEAKEMKAQLKRN